MVVGQKKNVHLRQLFYLLYYKIFSILFFLHHWAYAGTNKTLLWSQMTGKKLIVSFFSYQTIETYIPMYLKGNNITPNLFWVGNGLTSSHSTLYTHQSQRRTWWREQSFFLPFLYSTFSWFLFYWLISIIQEYLRLIFFWKNANG